MKISSLDLLQLFAKHGTARAVAAETGMNERALRRRLKRIKERGGALIQAEEPRRVAGPTVAATDIEVLRLKDRIKTLEKQVREGQKTALDEAYVREHILGLSSAPTEPPAWLIERGRSPRTRIGVPTLFASDWHWGEVVDPSQIGGVNAFDMSIARERAKRLIERTILLLREHMVSPDYPGIVLALGGDMFSGDIHEELIATNEVEIMPAFVDVFSVLIWCIETLADEFKKVFLPCVTGNHGRNTHKIRHNGRAFTNFDWLLYQMLSKRFERDTRIQFSIPSGPDCLYRVYNHRYLLTHGDQFRGGDGMIGALGPIIRGDHRKRSRNNQIDQGYDTLLLGHWHQLIQLQRLIVNGSLKGYDSYASNANFPFEPPRQGLWINHPKHGLTFSMPVLVEASPPDVKTEWVSWQSRITHQPR